MLEGPIGGAAFNNEFGRPNLCGYFRTFEQRCRARTATRCAATTSRSCSPAASATSAPSTSRSATIPPGATLIVLGGPAMLIGLGGGAASSMATGTQRRGPGLRLGAARQPGDAAPLPGGDRPLLGAGRATTRSCRSTTSAPAACPTRCPSWCTTPAAAAASSCARCPTTSPACRRMEIWCNEAQERYVLAVAPERAGRRSRPSASASAARSRWSARPPTDGHLLVGRRATSTTRPIDMPHAGAARQAAAHAARRAAHWPFATPARSTSTALDLRRGRALRVLRLPTVADKTFLITIGDRTVTGLVRARPDGRALAGAGGRCAR